MYPVRIEGPRVTLREVRPDDGAGIHSYAGDPQVTVHMVWDTNPDLATSEAAARRFAEEATAADRSSYELAVTVAGELVGMGRISVDSAENRSADLGYVLRRDQWGRGEGTEVASLLIDFGFATLGMHRIWATCAPANVASRRVLEKAGMVYEGHLRDHLWVRGRFRDSLCFAVLATDPRTGWRAAAPPADTRTARTTGAGERGSVRGVTTNGASTSQVGVAGYATSAGRRGGSPGFPVWAITSMRDRETPTPTPTQRHDR